MGVTMTNQLGKIEISDNTFAVISGLALNDCTGIAGQTAKKITDGISDMLGRDTIGKGVKINIENEKIFVDVGIVVEYGVNISKVAEEIIAAITAKVKELTGFEVAKVNVQVEGIKLEN